MNPLISIPFALLLAGWLPAAWQAGQAAAQTMLGRWEGVTQVLNIELPMAVEFSQGKEGLEARIDIQGVRGLALTGVRFEEGKVHFELNAGPGLAVWDGRLEGESIQGRFTQGGAAGEFSLHRPKPDSAPTETDSPKPFREEEASFRNGAIVLAGTLTLPRTPGPYPAAVLISGSGPQNRDEEIVGFRPFRLIAEYLSAQGVAVLRYDDRGVGGSTGSTMQSTTADVAADVAAAMRFLAERPDVDASHIGLIGHSDGAIAAGIAAAETPSTAFVVLLGGPAVKGEEILLAQAERVMRANGADEAAIRANHEIQREIFQAVRTGQGWEEAGRRIRQQAKEALEKMPAAARRQITDVDRYLDATLQGQISFSQSAWFKYFLDYDPASALERVHCPVLALFGELDLQVPHDINRKPMQEAFARAANNDVTIRIVAGANHLFQKAVTGSPNEYAVLKKEFLAGFLEDLSEWILHRVGTGRSQE